MNEAVTAYMKQREAGESDLLLSMWENLTDDEQLVVRCLIAGIPLKYIE